MGIMISQGEYEELQRLRTEVAELRRLGEMLQEEVSTGISASYYTDSYLVDQGREIEQLKAEVATMRADCQALANILRLRDETIAAARPIVEAVASSRQPSSRRTQARRLLERYSLSPLKS